MASSGNSKVVQNTPEVKFSIEIRPATSTQKEAGKWLFSRLIEKSQSSTKTGNESKQINTNKE